MLDKIQLANLGDAMFAALIDGLRLKDRRIKQNYVYAFVAIGSGAIPRLESAIEHGRPRAVHRRAIEGAIAKARNGDYERYWTRGEVPQSRSQCVLLALLNGLRADDARHHELVTAALRAAGRDIVSLLVIQAGMVDQLMPEWCVRLLVAAEHVDDKPGVYTIMDLDRLAAHENEEISEQAKRVLELGANEDKKTARELVRISRELYAAQGITI